MKTLAACLLAIFVLAGCGENLEKKVVGTWKVDAVKSQLTGEKVKTENDKKMMMAMMQTVSIDIKEDKSFAMEIIFPVNGTWALSGNKLTLTPKLKEGETFGFGGKNTMDFDVDASGASMSATIDDKEMGGTLVMAKETAAK